MGTFGRLVFCEVKTQIVGKTKFFDSLKGMDFGPCPCYILCFYQPKLENGEEKPPKLP